mmetsp:Transcript_119953/g.373575  ORF Transcript_119953/g.373575 Transcript_119953/m.373575 type:complete len:274 (-) Transcript_119953:77-898(-)
MFGGKKLKDLTEEDIRRYAESLAGSSVAPKKAEEPPPPDVPPPGPNRPAEEADDEVPEVAAPTESRKIAQTIAENSVVRPEDDDDDAQNSRSRALERVLASDQREEREQMEREIAEEEKRRRQEQEREMVQARLTEEEQLRLEVLAELDRSQMPAVQQEDGVLVKTIEHYTFADSNDAATISIDLDKDLFEGAAAHVVVENVEVSTRDTEVTILVHKVPAAKTVSALADWRLHLAPLFHSVDPDGTTFKVRKGKVSVKLRKKKMQEWRRVLKF